MRKPQVFRWLSVGTITLTLSLLARVGLSADSGLYIGASVGEQSTDYDWGVNPVDIGPVTEDRGLKIIGGFRPLDPLAIELNYFDFGTSVAALSVACPAVVGANCPDGRLALDASAVSVSAVGIFAAGPVDLFARAGLARWDSGSSGGPGFAGSARGTDPAFGVGAQFRVGSFALRLEIEHYDLPQDSLDVASIGFTCTFL